MAARPTEAAGEDPFAVDIAGRSVGDGSPCFIIAEAGVNHNGSVEIARQLIDAAAAAGADAVKFQTFDADRLVASGAPKAPYQRAGAGDAESQHEMLQRMALTKEAFAELAAYCRQRGLIFLSTPFDEASADVLLDLDVPAFKIASGELTNHLLVSYVARKARPMLVSTGMADLEEVAAAVRVIREQGNRRIVLLHCLSVYPADPREVNLRAMLTMRAAFQLPVGFSDHTLGTEAALAAVALGACVLEKHLTLDRGLPGPDHAASLHPDELKVLIEGVRTVEAALGHGRKEPARSEADVAVHARRSLVAATDIPAGAVLTEGLIALRRPGTGLSPALRRYVIGRRVRSAVRAGTPLTLEMLA